MTQGPEARILRGAESPMPDDLQLTIPSHLARILREAVESGECPSLDAALAEALRSWTRRHDEAAEELAWIRAKIRASLADPDPDLSEEEVDQRLELMFERARRRADEAA